MRYHRTPAWSYSEGGAGDQTNHRQDLLSLRPPVSGDPPPDWYNTRMAPREPSAKSRKSLWAGVSRAGWWRSPDPHGKTDARLLTLV
jgi:hypothetical protein